MAYIKPGEALDESHKSDSVSCVRVEVAHEHVLRRQLGVDPSHKKLRVSDRREEEDNGVNRI